MSLTDHIGISPAMVLGLGVVLFVIPEPITSVLGVFVVLLGLVWLAASRLR